MAKCKHCGKGGFFRKINKSNGLCLECEIQEKVSHQSERLDNINRQILNRQTKLDSLTNQVSELEKTTLAAIAKASKLKGLAKSITDANEKWASGDSTAARLISDLDIESLLPEQELNCMTMKTLRTRYTALRRQVIDLCKTYESRYTTKANATIYKLTVLGLEAELENILYKLQFGTLDKGVTSLRSMTSKYYSIAIEGNQSIAPTMRNFIGQMESLYLDIINTEYEYYVQRERAKEEQRALKEQMRQEAEERRRLEIEKKKVEAEEKKYNTEIERLKAEMQSAKDSEIEKLKARLAEVESLIGKVEEKKAEIVNLQNGKAGTIYIISNIGSFGENVFKVGMTRRIDPEERVRELGDASVPFPFDIHSFIFSQDAPALETALHKELNNRRVNKVNLRKEFFNITVEELQAMVDRYDPTAAFKVTAAAEQYRQSLTITDVPEGITIEEADEE